MWFYWVGARFLQWISEDTHPEKCNVYFGNSLRILQFSLEKLLNVCSRAQKMHIFTLKYMLWYLFADTTFLLGKAVKFLQYPSKDAHQWKCCNCCGYSLQCYWKKLTSNNADTTKGYSIWNPYIPCGRFMNSFPQGEHEVHVD